MMTIPALSIRRGKAVQRSGDRYEPMDFPDPLYVLKRLAKEHETILVLDLDAIEGQEPQFKVMQKLSEGDSDLWFDVGIDGPNELYDPFMSGAVRLLACSKRLPDLDALAKIAEISPDVIISLEFHDGCLLWGGHECPKPEDVLAFAKEHGYAELIIAEFGQSGSDAAGSALKKALETGFKVYVAGSLQPCEGVAGQIVSASKLMGEKDGGA
ncbi:MAG: hypothetical protein HZB92_01215 [Euryarchaeota archaeon]|nr:hypothetical protein [Euryarchaeota archaeon]